MLVKLHGCLTFCELHVEFVLACQGDEMTGTGILSLFPLQHLKFRLLVNFTLTDLNLLTIEICKKNTVCVFLYYIGLIEVGVYDFLLLMKM